MALLDIQAMEPTTDEWGGIYSVVSVLCVSAASVTIC